MRKDKNSDFCILYELWQGMSANFSVQVHLCHLLSISQVSLF